MVAGSSAHRLSIHLSALRFHLNVWPYVCSQAASERLGRSYSLINPFQFFRQIE